MNTPFDTALSRVEQLLQNSEMGLTIQRIIQECGVTEREAKASIKALHSLGQIEMIPTPGRWGPRYAWLAAKPLSPQLAPVAETTEIESSAPEKPAGDAPRFAVIVPKRKARIVRCAKRAQAAALAAVRNGAARAEVFELLPVGAAKRGAEWRGEA